ncbi:type II secretion system F family protein [Fontimonas sp. SYSU GA230001]|uniref:type II secretion system F family protein n=1 Tax=Fontimonas sp. SYSU GA230001 TaxID=3142450 RepID=UPI0032B3A63A
MDSLIHSPYFVWIFGGAIGIALTLFALVTLRTSGAVLDPTRRRLRDVEQTGNVENEPGVLGQIGAAMLPRSEQIRQTLSLSLQQAGFRDPSALAIMYTIKATLAMALPATIVVLSLSLPTLRFAPSTIALLLGAGALAGWWLPNYILSKRIESRQSRLMEGLPDALDLLVACTEAGLGLNAAIERVAEQMPASNPELAAELALVNSEIRAGVDRLEALRNLATRTGLKEIRGLVSLINHSMRFGTSIASTLRVYAEEFRDRRLQRAEELAATVGTKLIFPLIFCIFPSFFVVAVGPAIMGVLKALSYWPDR